jgi:hypothetical protein
MQSRNSAFRVIFPSVNTFTGKTSIEANFWDSSRHVFDAAGDEDVAIPARIWPAA